MSSRNTTERAARAWLSPPRIACIVLAAGAGARFGAPSEKLLARAGGTPLVQRSLDAACASSATTCALVTGAGADAVLAAIDTRRAAVYRNHAWATGIASSIRLAVEANESADACLFVLADAPHVGRTDLDALMDRWRCDPRSIVALRAAGVWGAPAIFGRRDFPGLLRLHGDHGAKTFARRHPGRLAFVDAADRRAFEDVDRREDLKRSSGSRTSGTRRSRLPR